MYHLYTLWFFTRSDFKTIVCPETAVGIFSALSGPLLTTNDSPSILHILGRIPHVALWNWLNLLAFNIANQRLPSSIVEDAVNKPWRPIAAKRISAANAQTFLFWLIPANLAFFRFVLGGFDEGAAMMILTWMYNELGGADGHHLVRNLVNAVAFIDFARGATVVAIAPEHDLIPAAQPWLLIIGCVIFTTMQMQDLPDMPGDAARGRPTLPLIYGERVGRYAVAFPVLFWAFACPTYWGLEPWGYALPVSLAALVAFRVLRYRNEKSDDKTFKFWCFWIISLYMLPLCKRYTPIMTFWQDL